MIPILKWCCSLKYIYIRTYIHVYTHEQGRYRWMNDPYPEVMLQLKYIYMSTGDIHIYIYTHTSTSEIYTHVYIYKQTYMHTYMYTHMNREGIGG